MTVLYFADTRFPIERANGAQTMATCHALATRGHDVTLVVRPDTARPARDPFAFYGLPPTSRLRIQPVRTAGGGGSIGRTRYLLAASGLAASRPDAVFTRDLGLAAFLLRWPARRRPRLVYEAHGIASVVAREMPALLGRPELAPSAAKVSRLERRDARVWRRAAAYVTITHALAEDLRARYGPREEVFVVPDGVHAPDGPPAPLPDGDFVVGYAGHLYPWKGVDVLIRALALLPAARGLVVGGHPGESDRTRVESLARSLGVADRVEFTGLVPPAEVGRQLARASALVLPNTVSAISNRYTSPLKLFEYLAAGRPIVASDLPALREVVTHEQTALLVAPGEPDALAAALRRLADDRGLAESLASRARQLVPQYTWAARAARLEAVLVAAAA